MIVTVVMIVALFRSISLAIDLPPVPCSHIFKYSFDGQKYVGIITIRGISYGETTVQVDMTQPGHVQDYNSAHLSLATNENKVGEHIALGRPITFKVDFPVEDVLPRITDITVNNAKICFDSKRGCPPRAGDPSIPRVFSLERTSPALSRTAKSAFTMKHTLIVNTPTSGGQTFNFDRSTFLRPPYEESAQERPMQYNPYIGESMKRFGSLPAPPATTASMGQLQSNPFLNGPMSRYTSQYVPPPRFTAPPMGQIQSNPFLNGPMSRFTSQYVPPPTTTTTTMRPMQANPFLNGDMSKFTSRYVTPPPATTTTAPIMKSMQANPFLNGDMRIFSSQYVPPPTTTTTTEMPMQENPFLDGIMTRFGSIPEPPPTTTTTTTVKPIYASEDDRYNNLYWVCGRENDVNVRGLVVHGKPMPRSRFPWIVAIYTMNREFMKFRCGGSLISQRTVISAAHCFKEGLETIKASELLLSIGRHNLSEWDNAINILVQEVIIHPDFRKQPSNMDADVAIVHLKESVKFSFTVRPICLWQGPPNDSSIEGTTGSIVGWGEDEAHKGISNVPRIVNATIVSESTCIRSNDHLFYLTSNRTLCAGNKDGSGPCKGDSGSGLMLRIGKKWVLRALVSTSLTNEALECNLNEYVIFSDVAKFVTWIKSYMLM